MRGLGIGIGVGRRPSTALVVVSDYVSNDIQLQAYLDSIGATFADWNNDIITELGYVNYAAANTALYGSGILKTDIDAAWAALNP